MNTLRYMAAIGLALSVLGCESERKLKELRDARTEWGKTKKDRVKYFEEQGMSSQEASGRFQVEDSFNAVRIQINDAAQREILDGEELKRILD